MAQNPVVAMVRDAIERLGWSVPQLHVATAAYGSVGTLDELREHLVTGNGLGPGPVAVLLATLHEELLEQDHPSPFYLDGLPVP